MTMKRSELINHISLGLNRSANVTTYGVDWLNFALEDLASVRNWTDMMELDRTVKTVADALFYPMPQNVKDILDCRYEKESMTASLEYILPEHYRKMYPHPENDGAGEPREYTREGDFLKLYPLCNESNHTIELFCAKWPEPFTSYQDDDCPLPRLEKALIARAIYYGARAVGDWERMQYNDAEYWRLVKKAAAVDGPPSDWTLLYAQRKSGPMIYRNNYRVPFTTPGETI